MLIINLSYSVARNTILIVTFSCSRKIPWQDFAVAAAAEK